LFAIARFHRGRALAFPARLGAEPREQPPPAPGRRAIPFLALEGLPVQGFQTRPHHRRRLLQGRSPGLEQAFHAGQLLVLDVEEEKLRQDAPFRHADLVQDEILQLRYEAGGEGDEAEGGEGQQRFLAAPADGTERDAQRVTQAGP